MTVKMVAAPAAGKARSQFNSTVSWEQIQKIESAHELDHIKLARAVVRAKRHRKGRGVLWSLFHWR